MKTLLEQRIRELRKRQDILLMSHCVLGYRSLDDNRLLLDALAGAGVEIIELQFPFSEPIADGPVLIRANHEAVASGITTDECFQFAAETTARHPDTLFVIMTYYNVVFRRGVRRFVEEAKQAGITGLIVPDLPLEEAGELLSAADEFGIAPILLVTPSANPRRLQDISNAAGGLVYCVPRKGVTGKHTLFSREFDEYLGRVRRATRLPIGVGFGVRDADDVARLTGKADVAIVCTRVIETYTEQGVEAAARVARDLRGGATASAAQAS